MAQATNRSRPSRALAWPTFARVSRRCLATRGAWSCGEPKVVARLRWYGCHSSEVRMLDDLHIRAVIADDEPLARRGIRQLLTAQRDVDVVGEARNGRETLHLLRTLRPDLLFLDVQMPEPDGFGVLAAVG